MFDWSLAEKLGTLVLAAFLLYLNLLNANIQEWDWPSGELRICFARIFGIVATVGYLAAFFGVGLLLLFPIYELYDEIEHSASLLGEVFWFSVMIVGASMIIPLREPFIARMTRNLGMSGALGSIALVFIAGWIAF